MKCIVEFVKGLVVIYKFQLSKRRKLNGYTFLEASVICCWGVCSL